MNKQVAQRQLRKPIDLSTMDRMAARVEIAKDVLASLEMEKIIAVSGEYLSFCSKKVIPANITGGKLTQEACNVCGLGSLFFAIVSRNVPQTVPHGSSRALWITDMLPQLRMFFNADELGEVELAFERGGSAPHARSVLGYYGNNADEFCKGLDDHDAMVKIMKGIVDNKGQLPWNVEK